MDDPEDGNDDVVSIQPQGAAQSEAPTEEENEARPNLVEPSTEHTFMEMVGMSSEAKERLANSQSQFSSETRRKKRTAEPTTKDRIAQTNFKLKEKSAKLQANLFDQKERENKQEVFLAKGSRCLA